MTEHDVPEALRALIAAERAAPIEDLAKRSVVRAKLAVTVGAAPLGAATGSALLGVKVLAGIALAVGIGAVLTGGRTNEPEARPAPIVTVAAPPPPAPPPPEAIAVPVEIAPTPVVAPPPTKRHAKSPPRVATAEPAAPSQTELLRDAISAMASGDASRALALTVRDEQFHPRGALDEEREALQIEALARLRRFDEARIARDEFLARYPSSIHRTRVRAIGAEETSR